MTRKIDMTVQSQHSSYPDFQARVRTIVYDNPEVSQAVETLLMQQDRVAFLFLSHGMPPGTSFHCHWNNPAAAHTVRIDVQFVESAPPGAMVH